MELVFHSVVQEQRKGHRNAITGLLMTAATSVMMVAIFFAMFELMGRSGAPIRGDFLLYIMSGVLLYMIHIQAVGAVLGSVGPTSAMMQHAPLNTYITIIAAALSSLYSQLLAIFVILIMYHTAIKPVTIDQPIYAFGMVLLAWFTGCSAGLVFLAIKPWAPTVISMASTIYIRLNMIASGKMFLANTLPSTMLALFDWNPLFHAIDQARGFVFINYSPHFSSVSYPVTVAVTLVVLGLMGEFYTRRAASASWTAGR